MVDRNFRSSYFGKVGIKGVEEKKSLEIILKENPLDTTKLTQFCLRYSVPVAFRTHVWKIILNVLPSATSAQEYVWKQRKEQFESLQNTVHLIHRNTDDLTTSQKHLLMFLIEQGSLRFEVKKQLCENTSEAFLAMHYVMTDITDSDTVSCYWLMKGLFAVATSFKPLFPSMVEHSELLLKKEIGDDTKYLHHLELLDAFRLLPLSDWFLCCFAGVLPENSCERIWDKVISGSSKILVCVAVAILINFRRPISAMNKMVEVNKYLKQIPDDSGDNIVGRALSIWQKHGVIHPPSSRSDSPVIHVDKC